MQALTTPKADMEAKIAEIGCVVARLRSMVISNNTPREDIINDIEKIIVGVPTVMQVKFKTYINESKLNLDAGLYTIEYK